MTDEPELIPVSVAYAYKRGLFLLDGILVQKA
jgi:hypothetical protein